MRHVAYVGTPDQNAIRALQTGYCDLFDARDADAYVALYTPDAVVIAPWLQEIRGAEKLRKAVVNTPSAGWHRALETTIEISGERATGICRFEACDFDGTIDTGRYEDEYVRTPAGWRIARRAVFVESRDMTSRARS